MKNLLFITYFFPPLGMGGVQRQAKICKYLSLFKWDISVLTSKPEWFYNYDYSLFEEIKNKVDIYNIKSYDHFHYLKFKEIKKEKITTLGNSNIFAIPDMNFGWYPKAIKKGIKLLKKKKYNCILVSIPPFSSSLIARRLSLISGVPYIIDYRDPWIDNKLFPPFSTLHLKWNEFLEKRAVKDSLFLTTINSRIKNSLKTKFPQKRIVILNQGYDADDFTKKIEKNNKFTICYMGSLLRGRKPDVLLKAIKKLYNENKVNENNFQIQFIGKNSTTACCLAKEKKIYQFVECFEYLEHKKALKFAQKANLLWLYIGKEEGENISTGKLYEYIGTGNPIVASIPKETAAADLLRKYANCYISDPDSFEHLAENIEKILFMSKNNINIYRETAVDGEFNRKTIAKFFSNLLLEYTK